MRRVRGSGNDRGKCITFIWTETKTRDRDMDMGKEKMRYSNRGKNKRTGVNRVHTEIKACKNSSDLESLKKVKASTFLEHTVGT